MTEKGDEKKKYYNENELHFDKIKIKRRRQRTTGETTARKRLKMNNKSSICGQMILIFVIFCTRKSRGNPNGGRRVGGGTMYASRNAYTSLIPLLTTFKLKR